MPLHLSRSHAEFVTITASAATKLGELLLIIFYLLPELIKLVSSYSSGSVQKYLHNDRDVHF